ncbi:MAG: DUF4870 domain-containing protein [Pseudomonadales bacterium]
MSDHDHTQASPPGLSSDERQWGMFAHLSALAGFIIPFGNVIGPLVVWQLKKNDMPFVDDQGKEALNFQITVLIAIFVSVLLMVIVIGALLLPIVAIGALILTVIGAVKANAGERYRYPFALRLVK